MTALTTTMPARRPYSTADTIAYFCAMDTLVLFLILYALWGVQPVTIFVAWFVALITLFAQAYACEAARVADRVAAARHIMLWFWIITTVALAALLIAMDAKLVSPILH